MFTFSTKLLNDVIDSGWDTVFTTPVMEIREGSRPDTADEAHAGNLLAIIDLPDTDYFAASVAGLKAKNGTWSGVASASGTPTWFRIKSSADAGAYSTTLPRLDGDIGMSGALSDLSFGEATMVADEIINIDNFDIAWVDSVVIVAGAMSPTHEAAFAASNVASVGMSGTVV